MKRIAKRVLIPVLTAILITAATYFVEEDALAQVPGSNGSYGGATTAGFPLPYVTTFCCGIANGVNLLPSRSFYNESNLLSDLLIWLGISLACASAFTGRRLAVAAATGAGLTLATLVLRPLSAVAPGYGAETEVLRPMGFPYEFLTYYQTGLGGVTFSGYDFNLSAALGDYGLWAGVALAIAGATVVLLGRRRRPFSRPGPLAR